MDQNYQVESLTLRFYEFQEGKFKLLKTVKASASKEEY